MPGADARAATGVRAAEIIADGGLGREVSNGLQRLEPLVGDTGSLMIFSGAQMHATVPNSTNRTRLSIDFRTIHLGDMLADRGAPNIDDASTGSSLGDYMRGSDLVQVPEKIIAGHLADRQPGDLSANRHSTHPMKKPDGFTTATTHVGG